MTVIKRWLGGHSRVVRCMPNTPALIGAGITGLYAEPAVDAAGREAAETVLGAVGATVGVEDEPQIDGVTAVSGSGPAYVFNFIEALEAAALEQGSTPAPPAGSRSRPCLAPPSSPRPAKTARDAARTGYLKGGTTEAALKVLAAHDLVGAVGEAVAAAAQRGRELGDSLGRD